MCSCLEGLKITWDVSTGGHVNNWCLKFGRQVMWCMWQAEWSLTMYEDSGRQGVLWHLRHKRTLRDTGPIWLDMRRKRRCCWCKSSRGCVCVWQWRRDTMLESTYFEQRYSDKYYRVMLGNCEKSVVSNAEGKCRSGGFESKYVLNGFSPVLVDDHTDDNHIMEGGSTGNVKWWVLGTV